MSVIVRFATTDDLDELGRLRWQLYTEEDLDVDESPEAYRDRFAAFARESLSSDDWCAWVAEEHQRLVGAMWLHRVPRIPAPGRPVAAPMGYLTNCYVEPSHRNRGLGSEILRRVVAWCEEHEYALVMA